MSRYMISVLDDDGEVIGRVRYNSDLDGWDGSNWTGGSTMRHKGLARLKKSGKYVLIYGTQWQGECDITEVISAERAVREIILNGSYYLFDKYPELKIIAANMDSDIEEVEE